jgi:hypothetical protein
MLEVVGEERVDGVEWRGVVLQVWVCVYEKEKEETR